MLKRVVRGEKEEGLKMFKTIGWNGSDWPKKGGLKL